jgi:hypothetical protein
MLNILKKIRDLNRKHPIISWTCINFGMVALLMTGYLLDIPFVILVAELMIVLIFIVIAVLSGSFQLIIKLNHEIKFLILDGTEEELKEAKKLVENDGFSGVIRLEGLQALNSREIPYWLDLAFDVLFTALLIYLGYSWIVLVYIIHIFLLRAIKKQVVTLEDTFKVLTLDEIKEMYSDDIRSEGEAPEPTTEEDLDAND